MNWLSFLSLAFVTIFTPGMNNIVCTQMGVKYGYKKSLKMLFGMISGFFLILVITNLFAFQIFLVFPSIQKYIGFVGAVYLIFLAYNIIKDNKKSNKKVKLGFFRGFFIQYLNPKGILFALMVNSVYILPVSKNIKNSIPYFLILMVIVFCAISAWNLFGTIISKYLKNKKRRKIINYVLALLLIYAAYSVLQT